MPVGPSTRRRKLLATAFGLVGAALVAEGVCRIDALFPGEGYDAGSMRGFLESRAAATSYGDQAGFAAATPTAGSSDHRAVPDPWSGWTSPAHIQRMARGALWFQGADSERAFDVVILGGSFAAQFGNVNDQRLRAWLGSLPAVGARPVELWNLSVAGQKQPSHLHRLTGVLASGWKPDLVVCIDGYNELAVSAENARVGVHPVQPSVAIWGGMARGGDVDGPTLDLLLDMRDAQDRTAARARLGLRASVWRSALLSRAWSALLSGPQADFRAARERYVASLGGARGDVAIRGPVADPGQHPGTGAGEVPGIEEGSAAWAEAARDLRAICDRRRIPLVHALQPGLDDSGSKPASEEETRTNRLGAPWRQAVRTGYPLLRARAAKLAAEGVRVRDGSRLFAERTETLYVDGCHLNDRGYELYGLAVAEWIEEALSPR